MTEEEFAARVEKLITDAEDEGLSRSDMLTELEGIVDAMRSEEGLG